MAKPACIWMINELLYNLEGDPVSDDSPYLVHAVDYCLLSVKTDKSRRDFLFQDMLIIPINSKGITYSNKKVDYIITSEHNSRIALPFKVDAGYIMNAEPLTFGAIDNPALKAQLDNLASGNTVFVGDDTKGITFKPSDIASLRLDIDSDLVEKLCKIPPSNRGRDYFLSTDLGKDSIDFIFTKNDITTKYQFTFLSNHHTMYKSVQEFNLEEYVSSLN